MRSSRITLALSMSAMLAASPAAGAQLDSEPTNDTQATADLLPLDLTPDAVVNFAELGASGSDVDFFSAEATEGEVLLGIVTPLGGLPSAFDTPDTMLATFDSSGDPLTFNDDSIADTNVSGDSTGSLFRLRAPQADTYRIGVTAFDDEDFDGFDDFTGNTDPHDGIGRYAITVGRVDPETLGGDFADTDSANDTTSGADPINLTNGTAAVAVNELDDSDSDVDFFELTFSEGDILTAMTAPLTELPTNFNTPDTQLGLFDSNGTLLFFNDDAGDSDEADDNSAMIGLDSDNPEDAVWGSGLHALIPADGTYFLGVTGVGDDDFDGLVEGDSHFETGNYALLVSVVSESVVVPGPASAILLAVGSVLLGFRQWLRRN